MVLFNQFSINCFLHTIYLQHHQHHKVWLNGLFYYRPYSNQQPFAVFLSSPKSLLSPFGPGGSRLLIPLFCLVSLPAKIPIYYYTNSTDFFKKNLTVRNNIQHSLSGLNPYFKFSSYNNGIKNIDVRPFIFCVFNMDEHTIRIDAPKIYILLSHFFSCMLSH